MVIIKSLLFSKFPELKFGFSTKIGLNRKPPFNFNLSYSVDDKEERVTENREKFFGALGLKMDNLAFQRQTHSDIVRVIDEVPAEIGESDALITAEPNIGLVLTSADCNPIFIYDKKERVAAAVHSGWKGTYKRILLKTLDRLKHEFNSKPGNLFVYIAPSISQKNYEVGTDVAELFREKYLRPANGKYLLDLKKANLDYLKEFGIPGNQIQVSKLCSYESEQLFHSYRREGEVSGRALGVIAFNE